MKLSIKHFSQQLEWRAEKNIHNEFYLVYLYLDKVKDIDIVRIRESEFYKYEVMGIDFYPKVYLSKEYKESQKRLKNFYNEFRET